MLLPLVGPNLPVIFDSVTLVARPFETVSLVSNNGFLGSSVVTASVSGLWSADPHFMSAVRTSDGGEGCVGCLHVPVPVGGSVSFPLSPGVYRIVVETGDVKSTVGVSATFTVNAATTTTTTTLPEFIVGTNDVWNGYGEVVVLDDAFRSGFRLATADAAATPVVARATQGRSNAAVIFDPVGGAIRGPLGSASTGVRFWAKVESGGLPSVYALVGGAVRGTVALTADGGWHEYLLSFGATLSGLELMLLGTATGTAKFLLDDVSLILPPAPPVPTTAPAPTGYWSTVVSVDWRAGMRCLVFPDANGYVTSTSCDFVALVGSLPASVSGVFSAIVLANQAMLDAGAVADDVYNTYGTGTYTHSVSTQVWVPGPPPVTVPPVPQYPDWGVVLRQYGNAPGETYGFETRFGSPPNLGSGFTTAYGAQQAVLASGALGDNPPYGNTYTHYSTTPPTTTMPVQTTTTTTVPPIVTTPTRPPAFSSYPNYLRSQKLKNDGAVAQCLTPGGSSIESFAANCDAGNALLSFTWDALAQGYLVKQGSTCLQVDYNAPDPQVLLPSGGPAAKVGWVACGSTGPGAVWVPTFVETDASSAGWYQLVPNARPGVPTPCLNLNIGASQSTQMLVEYNCQGGTHTEERWAPNESFWTAPGGTGGGVSTTTTPTTATTIPIGTDFFDAVETSIKSFNGGCVDHGDDGDGAITALGCPIWTPEGGYSQMLFHPNVDLSRCLQTDGAVLTIGDCAPFAYNQQVRLTPVGNQWHLLAFNSNVSRCLVKSGMQLGFAVCDPIDRSQWWTDDPATSSSIFGDVLPITKSIPFGPVPGNLQAGTKWLVAGFIPQEISKMGGISLYSGDNRSFTPDRQIPAYDQSRFVFWVDFVTGVAALRINPTCSPHHGKCWAPRPLVVNPLSPGANFASGSNEVTIEVGSRDAAGTFTTGWYGSGNPVVIVKLSVMQSDPRNKMYFFRPRVDHVYEFTGAPNGAPFPSQVAALYAGDCFPSVEMMREHPDGGYRAIIRKDNRDPAAMLGTACAERVLSAG